MSVQDKLERTLREMHMMISRGREVPGYEEYVLVYKKDMIKQLTSLSEAVAEMMEQYEVLEQSRARGDREVEKRRDEIVRDANRQAEDIYAASVLYTDDALGHIQDIIDNAGKSMKAILENLDKDIEKEKKKVRGNQRELKSQLEDLRDTSKYLKIIEERNKEIAKAKAKKEEKDKPVRYQRQREAEPDFVPVTADIKINEEYFERAGLTPDGLPIIKEEKSYAKPEIKINEEYFKRAGIAIEGEENNTESVRNGKKQTIAEALAEVRGEKNALSSIAPLTKEEDAAVDADMEAVLKENLDAEYFEWLGEDSEQDKSGKRGFSRFRKNS